MNLLIKFYKITSPNLHNPVYYAGYNLDDVKVVATSDYQNARLSYEEIQHNDIPHSHYVSTAMLDYQDAKFITRKYDFSAIL